MNRSIKFRAWDKRRKQVRDVLSVKYFQKPLPVLGVVRMVPEDDTLDNESLNLHSDIEIMQYTGLKDTNGVEIYEGDIVVSRYITPLGQLTTEKDEDTIGKITFENGTFSLRKNYMGYEALPLRNFCHKKEGEYQSNFGVMIDYSDNTILEVIGNIYENGELLNDK